MVLDPLTALSLAGNILQFIDFAAKVVSKCRGIHKSPDGVLPEDQELELVASDLARLSKRLEEEHWPKRETADEKSLHDLSNASIKIANELLDRVTKHRAADGTPHRKWRSLRDSFEKVWTKKELEALAARLAQLRSEISLHILVTFKEKFDLATLQQARRFDWLDSHTKYLIQTLSETRSTLESKIVAQDSSIVNLHLDARDHAEFQHAQTREVILQALQQYASEKKKPARSQAKQKNTLDMMKEEVLSIADPDSSDSSDDEHTMRFFKKARNHKIAQEKLRIKCEIEFRRAVLESLTFPTADNRRFTIAEAHTATFEWIYEAELSDTPWSSFQDWLVQGSGIYWLHGKAGSGKSTLMRFIYENPRTSDLLSQWTTTGKVLIAGFFFWNSGSPDQSSQLGLLRSLLHKILSQKENLVPVIFPTRYEMFRDDLLPTSGDFEDLLKSVKKHRWSLLELKHAFQRLLKEDIGHICLFIDGLDEYAGDPMEVVTLFKLAISKKIKICLSSRPWVVFEDAFSECPQLRLQDLTAKDIRTYVDDTLCDDERMKRLYDSQPLEGPKLVQEIVERAAGVFLWVRLVVSSLLRGLMNRDKIADLQRRIRLLPSELESLFTYMLKQVEEIYLEEGSRILRIMLMAQKISGLVEQQYPQDEGLSAIELSFALDPDKSLAITSPTTLMKDADVAERISDIDLRLKVRCAGLLEIPTYWQRGSLVYTGKIYSQNIGGARVQWLHRTVKDFLETDEAEIMLCKNTTGVRGEQFSPSETLLRSSVLQLKRWFLNMPVSNGHHPLPGLIVRAMTTAHRAETEEAHAETAVLDELDRIVHQLWQPVSGHWVAELFPTNPENNFLSLAHRHKLRHYIQDKICASPRTLSNSVVDNSYFEYLDWSKPASTILNNESPDSYLVKNKAFLMVLLRNHCNPNVHAEYRKSAWHNALFALLQQSPLYDSGAIWASIIDLFVRSSADKEAIISANGDEYDCRKIISIAFSPKFPEECSTLTALFPQTSMLSDCNTSKPSKKGLRILGRFNLRKATKI